MPASHLATSPVSLHVVRPAAPLAERPHPRAVAAPGWRIPLTVATVALLVRLIPAVLTYGTSDVTTWELLGRLLLNGENFYATQLHNWPPLWIYFTAAAVLASDASGLPFSSFVKLPPIAADACIAAVLAAWSLRRGQSSATATFAGLAYALNPVSILISGYHGQFDSLMLAPTVFAVSIFELIQPTDRQRPAGDRLVARPEQPDDRKPMPSRLGGLHVSGSPRRLPLRNLARRCATWFKSIASNSSRRLPFSGLAHRGGTWFKSTDGNSTRRLLLSGLALGLGIWFKPVALLLLPVLLPRLETWRDRLAYTALAVAPAAIGTLPFLILWPEDVATNFLGYSSWFGQWGYPVVWMLGEYVRNGTIPWWLPDPAHVSAPLRLMSDAGKWLLLVALAATWWFTYHRRKTLLTSILTTFAVFYVATNGFGVQYLLWIVPFAIAARDRWLWPFTLTATVLLLVAYTLGAAYLPQSVTPSNAPSLREFAVKLATIPTWLVCAAWAWSLLRRAEHWSLLRRAE